MAYDVFISHSSLNKDVADAVCHALEQNGVRCWIAPRDIPVGADYGTSIMQGIKNCAVFLLVFSDQANTSEAVRKEVERAVMGYKKIAVPFRLENIPYSDGLEYYLGESQWIDACADDSTHWLDKFPDEAVFDGLVKSVRNVLGMSAPQTRQPAAPVQAKPVPVARPISTPQATAHGSVAVGGTIHFGAYDWRVLDVQDGKALIITKDIIEKRAYNEKNVSVTWKTCSLRAWLNREFLEHFNADERARILETHNVNNDNAQYGTNGGNATTDNAFILSINEAQNPFFFKYEHDRSANYQGNACGWWLRSPGGHDNYAAEITPIYGTIGEYGHVVYDYEFGFYGVRPAMWIKIDDVADQQQNGGRN
jgi:hypothetical protein